MSTRTAIFLRGINVGTAKRVSMTDLTSIVRDLGADDVRTLLNSGNVVCTSAQRPAALATAVSAAIEERLGFTVDTVARTAKEIDAVVALDPLAGVATDPSRYLVTFLSAVPQDAALDRLRAVETGEERWELHGRELYFWFPSGVADSVVQKALTRKVLGVTWTGRNWATVLKVQAALTG